MHEIKVTLGFTPENIEMTKVALNVEELNSLISAWHRDEGEEAGGLSMDKQDHKSGVFEKLAGRRNFVSSVFIVILIGISYDRMIDPVRESIRENGLTLGVFVLAAIFFLTSMRFFIGNQLHIMSDSLAQMPGSVWFYDFMVIVIQTTLLIFLGGVTSVGENLMAKIGFAEILILLYTIDVLWIITHWLFGKLSPSWERQLVPWAWAALNSLLVVFMLILYAATGGFYNNQSLLGLALLNIIAFLVDVWLVDYYNLV